jgi:hypothetical protein
VRVLRALLTRETLSALRKLASEIDFTNDGRDIASLPGLELGYGCYLLRYKQGEGRGPHIDAAPKGRGHARLVALVAQAEQGGELWVDGSRVELAEGDAVLFRADLAIHAVTDVESGERLAVTLGFLSDPDYFP